MLVKKCNYLIVFITYYPDSIILDTLRRLSGLDCLIIDNSDNGVSWLEAKCKRELPNCLYWHRDNIGIAAALNQAAKYAIDFGYSHIFSLDQDSEINVNILERLVDQLNKLCNDYNIATISPKHISPNITMNLGDDISDDIFGLQSANFIDLNIWQEIGGFNEELFIDMVDTEYYIRAKLSGFSCITCNNIYMNHSVGENIKELKICGKYLRAFNHSYIRKYYQARNSMYVFAKYRKTRPEVIYFLKVLLTMPITILLFEDNKLKKLKYLVKGLFDWYFGKMGKFVE